MRMRGGKTKVALILWLKHGLQWRDQYMKFGPITAWKMAGYIWEFRLSNRGAVRGRELLEEKCD